MKKKETTQKDLANELGIHHVHLNGILKGRVQASVLLAMRIEKGSKGKYKAVDMRPDIKEFLT